MDQDRLERLLVSLYASEGSTSVLQRICVVCRQHAAVDGTGLTRIGNGTHELLVASDDHTALLELLQIDLGEGPSVDTMRSFRSSHQPDLASSAARARWPRFAEAAIDHGIAAAFAMPLLAGGVSVGSLGLYSTRPGELGSEQTADAEMLADLAALAVDQADARTAIAAVGVSVESMAPWAHPAVVHNATGMISEQLMISVEQSLLRLRAFAFVRGISVATLARFVVDRELKIEAWSQHG